MTDLEINEHLETHKEQLFMEALLNIIGASRLYEGKKETLTIPEVLIAANDIAKMFLLVTEMNKKITDSPANVIQMRSRKDGSTVSPNSKT